MAPGVNSSRTLLAASWTADSAGVQAALPGGGQLAAGEYIVQVNNQIRVQPLVSLGLPAGRRPAGGGPVHRAGEGNS